MVSQAPPYCPESPGARLRDDRVWRVNQRYGHSSDDADVERRRVTAGDAEVYTCVWPSAPGRSGAAEHHQERKREAVRECHMVSGHGGGRATGPDGPVSVNLAEDRLRPELPHAFCCGADTDVGATGAAQLELRPLAGHGLQQLAALPDQLDGAGTVGKLHADLGC